MTTSIEPGLSGTGRLHDNAIKITAMTPGELKTGAKGLTIDSTLPLHIKGSPFQLKVWEALLNIPEGQLASYKDLATSIGKPNASRAVGTALGQNPIAYLIPCHRVIKSTGTFGQYRWGEEKNQP